MAIPPGFVGNPLPFFDDFSWRSFVALTWPATAGQRGVADPAKVYGDVSGPVVWDTWKKDFELFQRNGAPPTDWTSFAAISPDPFTRWTEAGRLKVLGSRDSGAPTTRIEHYNQAGFGTASGTLITQRGSYVRYEIALNRTFYEFVKTHELYLGRNLDARAQQNGGQVILPTGSVEIKAAWYVFMADEAANDALRSRFYSRPAVLISPNGTRQTATLGLIGLHIVHRTPSRPEWIWSSFEHVDLLDGDRPLLRDPGSATPPNVLEAAVNITSPPKENPVVTQVQRVRGILESTQETNRLYRSASGVKGTVWENYQLVTTQWPVNPAKDDSTFVARFAPPHFYPGGAGDPFPPDGLGAQSSIANVSMETKDLFQRGVSCMRCHYSAGRLKTEFSWTLGLQAWRPQDDVPSLIEKMEAEERAQLKALQ